VESVRRLPGSTSTTLYGLDAVQSGRRIPLVLRLFDNPEWLAEEPDLAAHEANNLRRAALASVPTPELVAYDPDGTQLGLQATLMTRLPGDVQLQPPDLASWLEQMAEAALAIHQVPLSDYPWHYAPYNDITQLEVPTWSHVPASWREAIERVNSPWPAARRHFIHRDYHPNNILWQGESLSGVVDWPNACLGPAGIDVAWCRSNLAGLCGVGVADRFLDAYVSLAGSGFDYDPFWDLMVIIEGLPGPPDVYEGWIAHGVRHLTDEIQRQRVDDYLGSVLARFR
jgi:aminoglycoside phosphotransferase (APT) family kinase protein